MQLARIQVSQKLFLSLTNSIQRVNDKCWKISGMHLKFSLYI